MLPCLRTVPNSKGNVREQQKVPKDQGQKIASAKATAVKTAREIDHWQKQGRETVAKSVRDMVKAKRRYNTIQCIEAARAELGSNSDKNCESTALEAVSSH